MCKRRCECDKVESAVERRIARGPLIPNGKVGLAAMLRLYLSELADKYNADCGADVANVYRTDATVTVFSGDSQPIFQITVKD